MEQRRQDENHVGAPSQEVDSAQQVLPVEPVGEHSGADAANNVESAHQSEYGSSDAGGHSATNLPIADGTHDIVAACGTPAILSQLDTGQSSDTANP